MISSAFLIRGPVPLATSSADLQPFYSWFATHLTHTGKAFAIPVVHRYFAQLVALDVALQVSTGLDTGFLLQVGQGPDADKARAFLENIAAEIHAVDPGKQTSLNEYRAMFGLPPLEPPAPTSLLGKVKNLIRTYL